MEIEAAVLRTFGAPLSVERLRLDDLKPDEVLVKIRAVGVCHTDLTVCHGQMPIRLPAVLGHEGAGIVVARGNAVSTLQVGDHVVLSYSTCGECRRCREGDMTYCENFTALNFGGRRLDGSATLYDGETPITGAFFGQSSFSSHALVKARDAVRVPTDVPLDLLGPLGCGFQTGAGTVMNVLCPKKDDVLAVFGAGALGLAAVMAAKYLGCKTIIAVDRVAERLALAQELGASDVIDTRVDNVSERLRKHGGIDGAVETTGVPAIVAAAITNLKTRGICALHGMSADRKLELDIMSLLGGKTVIGVREGHAHPQDFIPKMIEMYKEGRFPIDRLIKAYPFSELGQAMADAESGKTVKPVLIFE